MAERLYLIDGTALAYRSHFAFAMGPRGGLSTKSGHPTSATYGFTVTLRSLLEREHPDHIAVAFDGAREDLERTRIYPEYKSTREKAPEEMLAQFDDIRAVVEAHGIHMMTSSDHEADDLIGAMAIRARDAGMEVFIVTGDKDFMQLVDDKIKLWNLRSSTSSPEIIGPAQVEARYGVKPDQMIDLLALMGDSSDNVPGVPRVGQKTACELLQQFGTLEAALDRADEIRKPSIRKAVQENRHLAELSKQLVTIRVDLDPTTDVAQLGPAAPDVEALHELFTRLEFTNLAASLEVAPLEEVPQHYRIVRTQADLADLVARLQLAGEFAFDSETTGLDPRSADIVGLSFSTAKGEGDYVPFNLTPPVHPDGPPGILDTLRSLLEDPAYRKVAQNAKYDMGVLRRAGVEVAGVTFDTMLGSYCTSAGEGPHNLDALAQKHFKYKKIPTKELIGTGKKQKTFDQIDIDLVGQYACEDADFTWRLREILDPLLDELDVRQIFDTIEMPLVAVLLDMEWEGIAVDPEQLSRLDTELKRRLHGMEKRIHERAGEEFNLNAPAQVGAVLFDTLQVHKAAGLRPKKTKSGQWKTDAAMLEKLAKVHEVPELLLEYRRLSKLLSTYVDTLPKMIHPDTGRIHTSFNQAVAATGRLSSDEPNLQNIPIRTSEGREVRKAFVARQKGWVLLSADYSQIELRILAHMSGDNALVDSFRNGEDIHARTAVLVHGLMGPDMVTPELRTQAKAINYGLMYGMGASRLAAETGMKPPEARKFIEAYFRALPKVKGWLDATLASARDKLEVRTLYGRRRALPEIESTNPMQRISAENMAVNTPIQGTAADIIKRAMLTVHSQLRRAGLRARMVLQVHDELVLDVPEDELEEVRLLVRSAMEGAADLAVPLEVSMGSGWNWLDAH